MSRSASAGADAQSSPECAGKTVGRACSAGLLCVLLRWPRRVVVTLAKGLIRAYQLALGPLIGHRCRFYPSCSQYALAVFESHGPITGLRLALTRLLRCHPFHPGGVDLPPPAEAP